jgi:hypothetical protein
VSSVTDVQVGNSWIQMWYVTDELTCSGIFLIFQCVQYPEQIPQYLKNIDCVLIFLVKRIQNIQFQHVLTSGDLLTTHLHLVLRSRMHGAIPPLPQYALIACCSVKKITVTTLHLPLPVIVFWLLCGLWRTPCLKWVSWYYWCDEHYDHMGIHNLTWTRYYICPVLWTRGFTDSY